MTTHTPLVMPRVSHVAAMPSWLVGYSPLSENHVPTTLSILHLLNTLCCSRQIGTFIFHLWSQSSRVQAAEIDRGRHILRMDMISRLTMMTFSVAEAPRHSVAPTDSIEEHLCFFIDIFNNHLDCNQSKVSISLLSWLVPSSGVAGIDYDGIHPCCPVCCLVLFQKHLCHVSLSKVSTDAKSNPEFIKTKHQGMPYCKDNHMCTRFGLPICEVLVVHNAQRGAECAYLPPHGNMVMVGDTRHP